MLHDQAGHIEGGEALERYLAAIGKTEEEVRAELRPIAELRLRRSLVLSKVAEAENIEVTDEEVEAEIETLTVIGRGRRESSFGSCSAARTAARRSVATC